MDAFISIIFVEIGENLLSFQMLIIGL